MFPYMTGVMMEEDVNAECNYQEKLELELSVMGRIQMHGKEERIFYISKFTKSGVSILSVICKCNSMIGASGIINHS